MNDGFQAARDRRNLIERLGAKIPGFHGYLEREMRREVDKVQRDWLAGQVDSVRHNVQKKIRGWTRGGHLANLDLASSIEKALDRLANRIRHADYGSTGFFDAVKIGENELDEIYAFDLALIEMVEGLAEGVDALPESPDHDALSKMFDATEAADLRFDERATVFEKVTQKGGA